MSLEQFRKRLDAWNRLTAVITPKNERTEYSYLATGELAQIKDALNNLVTFEYDLLGRLVKKTDALGFVTTRTYDENGNVATERDPNGNLKTFAYDSFNRLVGKTLPDNLITMAYDIRGNVTGLANTQSSVGLVYLVLYLYTFPITK